MDQESLNKAILTQWTKGFQCAGVVGQNIVTLLHEALERKGVGIYDIYRGYVMSFTLILYICIKNLPMSCSKINFNLT